MTRSFLFNGRRGGKIHLRVSQIIIRERSWGFLGPQETLRKDVLELARKNSNDFPRAIIREARSSSRLLATFACEYFYAIKPIIAAIGWASSRAMIRLDGWLEGARKFWLHGSLSGCAPSNTVYRNKWRVAAETRNGFHYLTGDP